MSTTASSMILRSLVLTGEKIIGGSLSTAEQTYYLAALNAMLESWSLERLMVLCLAESSLSLTSGTYSYTVGLGAVFNTQRPTKLASPCFIRDSDNNDYPLEIINDQAYGAIIGKSEDSSYPRYINYRASYPYGVIALYPPPTSGLTLYINAWKQLTQFGAIGETVSLAPGYERAIVYNFAIESSGGFTSVSPEVAKVAKESKSAIKSANMPDTIMMIDPMFATGHQPGQNIFTG